MPPAATRNDAAVIRIFLLGPRFDTDKAAMFVVVNSSRHDGGLRQVNYEIQQRHIGLLYYSVVNVHKEKMLKDIQMLLGIVVQITQTPGNPSRVQDIRLTSQIA